MPVVYDKIKSYNFNRNICQVVYEFSISTALKMLLKTQ